MAHLRRRWPPSAGPIVLGVLALTAAVPAGQDTSGLAAWRSLQNEYGLPGIDRGLAAHELPAEPGDRVRRQSAAVTDDPQKREPFARGGIIVKFRGGSAARSAAMHEVGGQAMTQPAWADFEVMTIPMDADPEAAAAALAARADVEYAQARYLNHLMLRPNDQHYALQWNFPAIDMERAWDIQPGATSEVIVAVIDSGVAFRNAAFQYRTRAFRLEQNGPVYPSLGIITVPFAAAPDFGDPSRFVSPRDFVWDDNDPVDLDGHGTHVAGTIGQATNNGVGVAGMAFNVRIMPIKVIGGEWDFIFSNDNGGTDDIVAQAVRYAADNGAHVINMSIGREEGGPAPVIEAAVRYAVSHGAFVVMASGNDGNGQNRPSRTAEFTGGIDGAVAVGAVGRNLNRAYYSTSGSYVELAAPGGDQRLNGTDGGVLQQTLDPGLSETFLLAPALFRAPRFDVFQYRFFQGTSMAAPHVAGFAALLRQQGLTTPAAIEAAMKRFATDRGPTGRDDEYGVGLINPRATLRGLGLAR
jgi:serine protease